MTRGARWRLLLPVAVLLLAAPAAAGRESAPIDLDVDASEAPRRIFHARLVIPAAPGPLTLIYPKWIPGEHGPTGPITDVAGLRITAAGHEIPWHRDPLDMYALRLDVPPGATAVEASFDFLSPPPSVEGFTAAASATARLAVLNWNQLLLYPAGSPPLSRVYRLTLRLPAGWKFGTALPDPTRTGDQITFGPVSLETLIDSPVICGVHFREVPLRPEAGPRHFLEIAADSEAALEIPADVLASYDRLVAEAGALFGARHYRSYRFLVALSDHVAHFGLEHHESSDNRMAERAFIKDNLRKLSANLLPHEFVHSWNGKHRRPADMISADLEQPQRTEMLWVYEGLTQYLGFVLAARSGVRTPDEARDKLALIAAWSRTQRGREWRALEDTATAAQLLFEARGDWASWRRGVDFYDEMVLVWLEADVRIRQLTAGERSLDDFCRRFHGLDGTPDGAPAVKPYTFDDLVSALSAVAPYDWRAFLTERVKSVAPRPPLAGIEQAGWRLSYAKTRSPLLQADEDENGTLDLSASLGIVIAKDGTIADLVPGTAADRAGVGPGMKLVAVHSRKWTSDVLRDALARSAAATGPLELLLENGEFLRTHALDYHEGEKYPVLVRDDTKSDLLSAILAARAPVAQVKTRGGEEP